MSNRQMKLRYGPHAFYAWRDHGVPLPPTPPEFVPAHKGSGKDKGKDLSAQRKGKGKGNRAKAQAKTMTHSTSAAASSSSSHDYWGWHEQIGWYSAATHNRYSSWYLDQYDQWHKVNRKPSQAEIDAAWGDDDDSEEESGSPSEN